MTKMQKKKAGVEFGKIHNQWNEAITRRSPDKWC